ncbi:MAG: hypothetical protein ABSA12_12415 [Verrucomicrobiia bacterium]|jgi:hypothetical protein
MKQWQEKNVPKSNPIQALVQRKHVSKLRATWKHFILGGCIGVFIFFIFWSTRPQQERETVEEEAKRELRELLGLPAVSSQEKYTQGYNEGYASGKKSALQAIEYRLGRDTAFSSPSFSSPWAGDPGLRLTDVQLHGLEYVSGYEAGYSKGFHDYYGW